MSKKAPLIFDKAMHEARKYWRDELEAISFDSLVAQDHPRPKDGEPRIAALERTLDDAVHARLRRIASGNDFLLYTALVAALKICCAKYTGRANPTLLTPSMGEGVDDNLLPLGGVLDAGASFKDVLLATKERLSVAYKNQQYPFSRMLLDLPEERRPKHLALIAALKGFHAEIPEEESADIIALFETGEAATKATLRHDARIFDEATIAQFFATFSAILQQGLTQMTAPISTLGAEAAAPVQLEEVRVDRLIEAQNPEAVAIVAGDRVTTYGELQREATRIAEELAAANADRSRPVAIVMDAGPEMVAAMLGALKAGVPFAPIKLLAGVGSLEEVLEALGAEYTITDGPRVARASARAPEARTEVRATPGEVACVLVERRDGVLSTSAVTHAELAGLFRWLNDRCGITAADRCLLSPGLGAAEQLYDTLGMLAAGASVEIADSASLRDTTLLADRLLTDRVTLWDLPTALAQNLLPKLLARHSGPNGLVGPRNILLSGEKQSLRLAEKLRQSFPQTRITGLYAPPAVGIWTTFFDLGEDAAAQAIPGFEHRVLNNAGAAAPPRVKGELEIRGADTGLRAQALDRARLRWLRGEEHCFVKYGCSVELTDVEAVLCEHEQVLAAEVLAVNARRGERLVVAFLIADPESVTAEGVRDFLVLRGDVDLIPDRFLFVEEYPLTADGAIDRDVLVRDFITAHQLHDAGSVETAEIHRQLKSIWLDILQVEEVEDDESFFARGGNSLKATLLIARISEEFSVDVSVQKFFREPTTRAVAQLIAEESAGGSHEKAPDFKVVSREKYRVQLPEIDR